MLSRRANGRLRPNADDAKEQRAVPFYAALRRLLSWRRNRLLFLMLALILVMTLILNFDMFFERENIPNTPRLNLFTRNQQVLQPPKEPLEEHEFLPNGLLAVNPKGRHPIYDLMDRAEKDWERKLRKQSRSLKEAATEYRRRYGRPPPKGFDAWWAYVRHHNVQLPDEYDQINVDLERFWAHTPAQLRELQDVTRVRSGTYTFMADNDTIVIGHTSMEQQQLEGALSRGYQQLALLKGWDEEWELPDGTMTTVEAELIKATGFPEATFTIHDGPGVIKDWELYRKKKAAIASGQVLDVFEKPKPGEPGWRHACPASSSVHEEFPDTPAELIADTLTKTFIWDHKAAQDPCKNPDLLQLSGFFSSYGRGPRPSDQQPLLFTLCTTMLHGDIMVPPVDGWTENVGNDPPWEEKLDERLVWRGSNTGIHHGARTPWKTSHRIRLVRTADEIRGNRSVLPATLPEEPVGDAVERPLSYLNPVLTDIAFTGNPVQCEPQICGDLIKMFEWRGRAPPDLQNRFKYIFDIDGNGWTGRYKRLMTTEAVVFKSTVFPAWYSDRIQPWLHYVPIKLDLTDLYDAMIFFRGDVADMGQNSHDELAEKIAVSGKEWSKKFFRKEDMVAYTYRLFLEYGRLLHEDRDKMNLQLF